MRTRVRRFWRILAVACLSAAVSAVEVQLELGECPGDTGSGYHPHHRQNLETTTTLPAGDWKLPELKSSLPVYAVRELGGRPRLFVLDCATKDDAFYNRLYFDANGNGDLRDDFVLEAVRTSEYTDPERTRVSFPLTKVTWKLGGKDGDKEVPYSFTPYLLFTGSKSAGAITKDVVAGGSVTLSISTNSWYRGSFAINGDKYNVLLSDSNVNGLVGDVGEDRFYLSESNKDMASQNVFSHGDLLYLGEKRYQVGVDLPNRTLLLKSVTIETVRAELSMEVDRLSLSPAGGGGHGVMLCKLPGKEITLPPGRYRLGSYLSERKDSEGDVWRVSAVAGEAGPEFEVGADAKNTITFGEPFTAQATIPEEAYRAAATAGAKSVPLEFGLVGAAGEQVTDVRHLSGENTKIPLSESRKYRAKEPGYRIVKPNGELVTQGTFQYG